MTAPNMATMTASLERSLQNCSLNGSSNGNNGGFGRSASSDDSPHEILNSSSIASSDDNISSTLDLNSESALPYHWEQCLDLKTGEIYFVNWRNGTRTKDDPRKCHSVRFERDNNQYYFSDEEDSSYDSEGSSSASSPSDLNYTSTTTTTKGEDQVLVVAGCKSCMMYFMLPKRVEECPKCNAFLLHFDGSDHKSP
ncbi:hypothetical protein Sjap_023212 [Stephania japonica]|uniref:WW domain-containing protein n=1 Tax=Stephania japonica TaxID=461633 RepID=A0AAP0EDB1_9MAGN